MENQLSKVISNGMDSKLMVLLSVFVGLIIGMNLLGGKIVNFFGVAVSVGIFMVPITFLITDIVAEVYGKKTVQWFIYGGVITLLMILAFIWLFVTLEPHARYTFNKEYITIFGLSTRIIIASIVAFMISQMHDIFAFEYWKKKTNGKKLWLRNNLSTIVSQMLDTIIFMFIAFYQITPKFTAAFIISLAIPYYLFKVLFAIIDTPLVYLGVKWLKK